MDEEAMRRRALEIRNMGHREVMSEAGVAGYDLIPDGATKIAVWVSTEVLLAGLSI